MPYAKSVIMFRFRFYCLVSRFASIVTCRTSCQLCSFAPGNFFATFCWTFFVRIIRSSLLISNCLPNLSNFHLLFVLGKSYLSKRIRSTARKKPHQLTTERRDRRGIRQLVWHLVPHPMRFHHVWSVLQRSIECPFSTSPHSCHFLRCGQISWIIWCFRYRQKQMSNLHCPRTCIKTFDITWITWTLHAEPTSIIKTPVFLHGILVLKGVCASTWFRIILTPNIHLYWADFPCGTQQAIVELDCIYLGGIVMYTYFDATSSSMNCACIKPFSIVWQHLQT